MEWINPERAHVVAAIRQQQAQAPTVRCRRCKGAGQTSQAGHGVTTPCLRCAGTGEVAGGARLFVTL